MNAPAPRTAMLSEAAARAFAREIAKYPPEGKASAVIACLAVLQEEHGFISAEAEEWIAEKLGLTPVQVHEVMTFYTMLHPEPVGRHHLQLCRTLPCLLRGAGALRALVGKKLGIENHEKSDDGRFSLEEVECLGACGNAPVLQVNDDYHWDLTVDKLDRLLDGLK